MASALRELMSGVIDYAGLFPPAALKLEPAFDNYIEYRRGVDRWMLGRFICPTARLSELADLIEARRARLSEPPLPISVIFKASATPEETLEQVEQVASVGRRLGGIAEVQSYELRLPEELLAEERTSTIADALARAHYLLTDHGATPLSGPVFWERPIVGDFRRAALEALIVELGRWNSQHASLPPWGLKLRCGGLQAAAIPECRALAATVSICLRCGVPFKATAGLHHPLRRLDEALGAKTHGFFNLFAGAVLARAQELGEPHLYGLMAEESTESFRFTGDRLAWRDFEITDGQIRHWRDALATSFGSCSFDEPREDLVSMGLLERNQ